MDRLKIIEGVTEYTLPIEFTIKDDNLAVRSRVSDRVFAHGAVDISDGKINEKIIRLEGIIYGDNRAAYLTNLRALREKIYQEDYKLYQGDPASYNYFINIAKALKIQDDYMEGQDYCAGKTIIDLLALDPFWYYKSEDSDEETITEDGHSWTVTNNGNVNVYPVITITADTTIANLIIQNETDIPDGEDEGLKFQYQDPAFKLTSPTLAVDCQGGTVYRSETNTIRYFSGAFLKLLPGDNTIKWTGSTLGASKLKFEFRRRFL